MPSSRTLKVKKRIFTTEGITKNKRKLDTDRLSHKVLFKVSLLGMKVGFGGKNLEKYLLQLKKLYKQSLFVKGGVYSCLAFFSLGMMNISLVMPRVEEPVPALQEVVVKTVAPKTNTDAKERCYWQENVAQFFALQEKKKNATQTDVPCDAKPSKTIVGVEEKQVTSDGSELGTTIGELTDGYPIQVMAKTIATYDRGVAALIVGIAKKESDWGKHVPVDKAGADCFNYWGYKGAGSRGVEMGHGCFGSPDEAVTAVGNRLKELVALRETSAPASMIIWKCGSSCKGHSDESVKKWISDVSIYYNRIASR